LGWLVYNLIGACKGYPQRMEKRNQ
jgi:hypothetical protein